MLKTVHPITGALALATITAFWLSTILAETFAGPALIVMVKTTIPWGFYCWCLVWRWRAFPVFALRGQCADRWWRQSANACRSLPSMALSF
nr:hypothetical protein [Marinicella sp. W31]MDC2875781.1 hypothetical protein [Marinicella sp. W31]